MAEAKLQDAGLSDLVSQDSKFFFLPPDADKQDPRQLKSEAGIFDQAPSTAKVEQQCPILTSTFVLDAVNSLSQDTHLGSGSSTGCKSEPSDASALEPWNLAPPTTQTLNQKEAKIVLLQSLSSCSTSLVGSYSTNSEQPPALQDLPKRCRTNLTDEQKLELEKTFAKSKYPDYTLVDELSRRINLPYKKVLVWFKNRRAKDKRARKSEFPHCDFGHHAASLNPYAGGAFGGQYYATTQYSLRPCLPAPYHAAAAAAAAGYWVDRDPLATHGMKCEGGGGVYPFPGPAAHYVFVAGENMATQTSPTLEFDDDSSQQQELEKAIVGRRSESPGAGGYLPVMVQPQPPQEQPERREQAEEQPAYSQSGQCRGGFFGSGADCSQGQFAGDFAHVIDSRLV